MNSGRSYVITTVQTDSKTDYVENSRRQIKTKANILHLKLKFFRVLIVTICPFVQYFRTLFWDDIMIIWDENIVYFYN